MRRIESTRSMPSWTALAVLAPLAAAVLLPGAPARAQDDDKEREEQVYRELTQFGSTIELGFLWNSDATTEFGNYTGLQDDGFDALANIDARWRGILNDDDASYLRLRGLNLGLDSRYADLEFGRQGRWGIFFEYDQLPVWQNETASTFFVSCSSPATTASPATSR